MAMTSSPVTSRTIIIAWVGADRSAWAWRFESPPRELREGEKARIRLGQDDGNGAGWRQTETADAILTIAPARHPGKHRTENCICPDCHPQWVAIIGK